MSHNDPYYRIIEYKDKLTVACMHWFDEFDVNEDRFLKDENGERYKFETEEEAIAWLKENVKEHLIDDEYRNKTVKGMRDKYLK